MNYQSDSKNEEIETLEIDLDQTIRKWAGNQVLIICKDLREYQGILVSVDEEKSISLLSIKPQTPTFMYIQYILI